MSTAAEQVWAKTKQAAQEYSTRGVAPTMAEAEQIVSVFMGETHCDPGPNREALEFFATEMVRMTEEFIAQPAVLD